MPDKIKTIYIKFSHEENDFAKVSKNLASYKSRENNFVEPSR